MIDFGAWCVIQEDDVGAHALTLLKVRADARVTGRDTVAALVPNHYASEEHVARALQRLGKEAAAKFIRDKLPTTKKIRSGDLGEILATEFIAANTGYEVPIRRLRWKDHRNMAMRGDDVIGLRTDAATQRLRFLKTESKSRATLQNGVLADARSALDKDNGLPSPHALSFVSERLLEAGNAVLADAIDDAQLKHGIPPQSVEHLLFVFSGTDPKMSLQTSLQGYTGAISQHGVGLCVDQHGAFVAEIYDQVIANAHHD